MTANGTFINGAERVIVSQLVRSPGVYYTETRHGKLVYCHYHSQPWCVVGI